MAKKNSNIIEELTNLPWWFGFLLGCIAYAVLAWIVPTITVTDPFMAGLTAKIPELAPIAAFIFFGAGVISAIKSWSRGQLFNSQSKETNLKQLNWSDFEQLVAEYFKRQGLAVYAPAKAGADGGIDIELSKDGQISIVQCKHWNSKKVGVAIIREMYGVMTSERASFLYVVSSGTFTKDATEFAQGKPIFLINGEQLRSDIKVSVPVLRESSSAIAQETVKDICPKCSSDLVIRVAKKGINAGNQFLGCSGFPKCRHTEQMS